MKPTAIGIYCIEAVNEGLSLGVYEQCQLKEKPTFPSGTVGRTNSDRLGWKIYPQGIEDVKSAYIVTQ